MLPITIEIQMETSGDGVNQPDTGPLLVELFDERVTVAELIRRTVLENVRELLVKRRLDVEQAREILQRQYLTQAEVERRSSTGKIAFPTHKATAIADIDAEAEVVKALRGFEQGVFFLFVDGHQARGLEEEVWFRPGSKVVFLRVLPLAGG